MPPFRSLSVKLVTIGGAFLLLALASIGLTLWVAWQLQGGAAAVNEAGRLRMQAWQLAFSVQAGDRQTAVGLARRFDHSLQLLRAGDPSRPLFVPWDDAAQSRFVSVQQQWRELQQAWLGPAAPTAEAMQVQARDFVAAVDALVSAIERRLAHWTTVLNNFQLAMLALAIGSAVVLLYTGYLFVVDPLRKLKTGLLDVERGDLGARVEVASSDEFGALSAGFNRMAERLQSLYRGLEDKVQEKTAKLEVQHERLSDLYQVSAFLARSDSLDDLADGFARKVRRIAHADAAAIRWSDEANRRYLLLAGDCLPRVMAEDEHCLLTGSCHCGQPQAQARTRVIPIHAAAPAPFDNCARAGYETLVSVPVLLQERVLGEIDLFYRSAVVLSDEERGLLDALASHLASAMEGLRASALEREAAVAEERGLLARELHDSIAQSLAFLKIQVQLLRDAQRRGDALAIERAIGELDTGLRESTADVRELLLHFRTRTNAEDIEPALRSTLQKFEHQTGLTSHLAIDGEGLPLEADVQVQVLHVIQEALSNVRKHAGARGVWLDVESTPQWRFTVCDDGQGFDPAADAGESHVGLRIMRERAQRIGAALEIDAAPRRGTRIALTLPARAARYSAAAA